MHTPSTRSELELAAQRAYERARRLVFDRIDADGPGGPPRRLDLAQRAALRELEAAETALRRYRFVTYGLADAIPSQVAS